MPSQDSNEEQRSLLLMFPAIAVQGVLRTQHHSLSPYHTLGRVQAVQGLGLSALVYSFLHLYDLISSLLVLALIWHDAIKALCCPLQSLSCTLDLCPLP